MRKGCPMKEQIKTNNAPAAIGPYSQGVDVKEGRFIFVSGQIPVNPQTGQMPEGIKEQTRQSILNIKAVLEAAGGNLGNVVKTTVFLKDMNDFAAFNEVYAELFAGHMYPARSTVEVARLPKDALVEIEAIAVI